MRQRPENRFTIDRLLAAGPTPSTALREGLGVSAPTLSRLVAAAGDRVLRLGRARAVSYALSRRLPDLPVRLPVFRIDAAGREALVAHLLPITPDGTYVELASGSGHLHAGLPPVAVDMTPSGYLGRRFAACQPDLPLPPRLQDWGDDQRLVALARRGEDLPGDLVLGEESMDRWLAARPSEAAPRDFPRLAEASAAGGAGSSAAGEQPKFTAIRNGRHVLVKFTSGDGSPSDARWRDLLVCEAIALELLSDHGLAASRATVVDVGSRRFLEVERFDRIGARGRRGALSLGPLDDDLFGHRDTWTEASHRLERSRLLSSTDARRIRLLDAFGAAILNGDRHFGNLGFFADGLTPRPRLALAPVYDMLPMSLAPNAGHVPALPDRPPTPRALLVPDWNEATTLAGRYWRRVAKDRRVGAAFRKAAAVLVRAF
jgi:hypothetical protein